MYVLESKEGTQFIQIPKQAGAELGQAQIKLELGFTSIKIELFN